MALTSDANFAVCNHLIVVCCHAIYTGGSHLGASEDEWLIEPFQKGETPTFINHVKAGLKALTEDSRGLLVFSGGPTKKPATELSEGQSYLNLARDNNYFQDMSTISTLDQSRVIAETNATDSYQNLLFSLIQFWMYTGVYPRRVTVVTHEFKRARFMQCHFPAVGLVPVGLEQEDYTHKATVIGINPPEEITLPDTLTRGEATNGIGLWREDLYGVNPDLVGKRVRRGWSPGMQNYTFSCLGLESVVLNLILYDGGDHCNKWFPKRESLPWSYTRHDTTKGL
ncbi:Rossmann-like alpha/beta/alpha sandwich fold [Penicillium digitatum]|nr:Rossmann-like alpha/beta/alpha sandwich fold [Penicillium digitatum]